MDKGPIELIKTFLHGKGGVKSEEPEEIETNSFISELNEEQQKAVLSKNKRLLVLAGAGAGKTKTIIQKILHLISNENVSTRNILAITFTKNAANEMIDRIILSGDPSYQEIIYNKKLTKIEKDGKRSEYLKKYSWMNSLTIKTFHSFCYIMLRKYGTEFDNKFKILMDNTSDLEVNPLSQASETPNQIIHKIIVEKCEDVDFLLELKRYVIDHYVDRHEKIQELGKIDYHTPYTTLKGDKVKSKSERDIADWLYRHKIIYEYEPLIAPVNFEFKPDFFIPEADLYLEHVSNISYPLKDKEREMKLAGKSYVKIHEKITQNSSLFNQELEKTIVPLISRKLDGITYLNFSEEFKGYEHYLNRFIFDVLSTINKIKVEDEDTNAIYDRAKNDSHGRIRGFYKIFKEIYKEYRDYCTKHSYLDFNDLITETIKLLEKNKKVQEIFQKRFKYILVDEFQDVNTLQVKLLKLVLNKETQLFCVGDDWQSIYGFRGSNVKYIIDFKKIFNESEIIKLNVNYRCNNTIVCASNEVIKKNKFKIKKEIHSFNKEGRKIYLYNSKNEAEDGVKIVLEKIKQYLNSGYKKEEILILSRTTKTDACMNYIHELKKIGMRLNTIHSAKGLEAKIVFIIGLIGGNRGFPNVWGADRIMQMIKPVDFDLLMEEERRLFYVALTRAKEELYLISEVGNESEFIADIPGEFIDRHNFLLLNIPKTLKNNCRNCNKDIDNEFSYCPYCGEKTNTNIEMVESPNNIPIKSNYIQESKKNNVNAYSKWTADEEKRLCSLFDEGKSIKEISKVLERKIGAISARLIKLGKINSY